MFCSICGTENPDDAVFCCNCGSRLGFSVDQKRRKCEYLKSIRNQIAKENGIAYVSSPCTSLDPCEGICPACEAEAAALREMINAKKAAGDRFYGDEDDVEAALTPSFDTVETDRRPRFDQTMGYMTGPPVDTWKTVQSVRPTRESLLCRIKKAFGK